MRLLNFLIPPFCLSSHCRFSRFFIPARCFACFCAVLVFCCLRSFSLPAMSFSSLSGFLQAGLFFTLVIERLVYPRSCGCRAKFSLVIGSFPPLGAFPGGGIAPYHRPRGRRVDRSPPPPRLCIAPLLGPSRFFPAAGYEAVSWPPLGRFVYHTCLFSPPKFFFSVFSALFPGLSLAEFAFGCFIGQHRVGEFFMFSGNSLPRHFCSVFFLVRLYGPCDPSFFLLRH